MYIYIYTYIYINIWITLSMCTAIRSSITPGNTVNNSQSDKIRTAAMKIGTDAHTNGCPNG